MSSIVRISRWLLCIVCIIGFISFTSVYHFKAGTSTTGPIRCGLVFGSVVHGADFAGPGIQRRVQKASSLFKSGQITTLIMSGGIGRPGQESEGEVMKRYAINLGIPTTAIIVENGAKSTWQNLRNSRFILEQQNCTNTVAISDRYHLARILFSAYLQGVHSLHAIPAAPPQQQSFEFTNTLREVIALPYYAWWHGVLHRE